MCSFLSRNLTDSDTEENLEYLIGTKLFEDERKAGETLVGDWCINRLSGKPGAIVSLSPQLASKPLPLKKSD